MLKKITQSKFFMPSVSVIGARLGLFLIDPATGHGMAFGWAGGFVTIGILLLTTAVACMAATLIPFSRFLRRPILGFSLFTFGLGVGLNWALVSSMDHDFDFVKDLSTAQIEYFCQKNFNRVRCVQAVNGCTACLKKIERWKRQEMATHLKPYVDQIPNETLSRMPAQIRPAGSAAR
ncbi:MAG: hypothetical protein AB7F86_06965 [Bdellovibrionales bacterium]